MSTIQVQVPDIGDFHDVAVIEILVKPGDTIAIDQSLITVESDKASMEIPSTHAGVVQEVLVKLGDTLSQGSVVLSLTADSGTATQAQVATAVTASPVALAPASPAEAKTAATAPALTQALRVPDIGDFKDVAVIEVMVKPGDLIALDQSLITVESDKAAMEIPASMAGVLVSMQVKVGDRVNQGDVLGQLQTQEATPPTQALSAPVPASVPTTPAVAATSGTKVVAAGQPAKSGAASQGLPTHQPSLTLVQGLPHASPSVRKFARELGVPLTEVTGTGQKGRITQADVQNFTQQVMSGQLQTQAQAHKVPMAAGGSMGAGLDLLPWPQVDFAKFGPIEHKPLGRIKKISAANLTRNAVVIPAVTNHDDADITDLEGFRVALNKEQDKSGVKVTMLAFLIKASVAVLKEFPEFNSSLAGDELVFKHYWNIGFAADTPNGLMVPVIKNADQKGVLQISREMAELAKKAREGKLGPADMTGATFTISSLGGIGGRYFTPIINAPEVAILGVCKSRMEPVWNGQEFVPKLMLPLSLTWDHRVIDGAAAARFNARLAQILADMRRVLL